MVFNWWIQSLCETTTVDFIASGLYLDHTWPLSSLGCSNRSLWCGHRWSCSDSHRSGGIHTRMCPGDILHRIKTSKNSVKSFGVTGLQHHTSLTPHVPVPGQQMAMCHQNQISPGRAPKRTPRCAGEREIVFRCVFILYLQCCWCSGGAVRDQGEKKKAKKIKRVEGSEKMGKVWIKSHKTQMPVCEKSRNHAHGARHLDGVLWCDRCADVKQQGERAVSVSLKCTTRL